MNAGEWTDVGLWLVVVGVVGFVVSGGAWVRGCRRRGG